MSESAFVYVTYIASTPQKIWESIIRPEFARQYWGHENISDWKPGARWEHREPNGGKVRIVGKVTEFDPPQRLVLTWADPALEADPSQHSRVTFEIEPVADMVRLTVTHDGLVPGSPMEKGVTNGWPRVLSSLKSFLETGKALDVWAMKEKPAAR